jgi:ABC-type branched-subunit amino acid transport system ATPase component
MDTVISVERLRKSYGSVVAVEDVTFGVDAGEIFGLLGPNGAGKTTIVECCKACGVSTEARSECWASTRRLGPPICGVGSADTCRSRRCRTG